MSNFTPGPWEVGPVDDTVVTHLGADGIRYEVAAIDGDYNEPDTWPIMEANARLIAAAPDLYAFAEEVKRRCIEMGMPGHELCTLAEAALSKAGLPQ